AHEQVERERRGEDVVLVELWRGHHEAAEAGAAERVAVEAAGEQEALLGRAQPGEDRAERRLAAAGAPFEEEAVARRDLQRDAAEDLPAAIAVAEAEVARLEEHRGGRARREREQRLGRGLGAPGGAPERPHLLPRDPRAGEAGHAAREPRERAARQERRS